jgi:exopolyphosphatase/guanosine-5'-triphosphate,3'-diphosphate pyrophosphatase
VPVKSSSRVAAAIDIGSNSVHVLAARATRAVRAGDRVTLEALADESDLIGLGDVADAGARIPPEKLRAVVDALQRQIRLAEATGASRIAIVGTEPLRRASNADELVAAVARYTGHSVEVLNVRQEAELTFLGVTGGAMPDEALAVADIGGGSTEASVYMPGHELDVVALPLGSGRLTNAIVSHDPPTMDELSELMAAARDIVDGAIWPEHAGVAVRRAIFVGGTATNVARLGLLDRAHLNEDLSTLARMSADEVVAHYAVRPRRARQLAAGVAIVSALLDRFLLGQAEVSDASLRDGAIIASLARGDAWLQSLPELIG